jgi:hypothetical protein
MNINYQQEIIGVMTSVIFKASENNLISHMLNQSKDTLKLLRCWGENYPYINSNRTTEPSWLPVPENSEAQKIIRNLDILVK